MQTFAPQRSQSPQATLSSRAPLRPTRERETELQLRDTGAAAPFLHDFSRISIHPFPAPAIQRKKDDRRDHESDEEEERQQAQSGQVKEKKSESDSRSSPVLPGKIMRFSEPSSDASDAVNDSQAHEAEAERTAGAVLSRLGHVQSHPPRSHQSPAAGIAGLSRGRALSPALRRSFEGAFDWDFSGVRLHTGNEASGFAAKFGARAFTHGRDIVFGSKVTDPESSQYRRLLAHELTHVVQQDLGAGVRASTPVRALASASPRSVQAAPLVTNVVTSAAELGVGGRDIAATATVAGHAPPLQWTINPGAAPPAGVSVIGTGRRVRIRSAQPPPAAAAIGGNPITIRAAIPAAAPADFFDSPPVMMVQVTNTAYVNAPPLANVPSLIPGVPPPNTAEPNRDGIGGNSVTVNATTAPAGRPVTIVFRRALGAALAGNVITSKTATGDILLRITDTATLARLNETAPSTLNPPVPMATLVVNAVPTRVTGLAAGGAIGPYGQINRVTFAPSDKLHLPLTRIVGELITGVRDDFNIAPPNGAFNNAFVLAQAVPANQWNDQLLTPAAVLNVADGRQAIDVNRFVGPGVAHLPRRLIYRQRFLYSAWQGAGAVVSRVIADGQHIRSLIGAPGAFQFRTEDRFPPVAAPPRNEAYAGNPLIILSNITAAPTAAGATALAADGAATANLTVNSTVAGRSVNWSVLSGDVAIAAGNPAALPAAATLRAGVRTGSFKLRAADTIFPNRRADGRVRVAAVQLRGMTAAPRSAPAGVLTSNVSVTANPGGRTLNWAVDAAATAAGVTVAPPATGPGLAMNVTVTRPAAFHGRVTVTATDSVLAARTARTTIQFR